MPGAREGHLVELFEAAGLHDVCDTAFTVSLEHQSFEEWWEPYTRGVGPAGAYVAALDDEASSTLLRERCLCAPPRGSVHVDFPRLGGPRPRVAGFGSGVYAPARFRR